MLGVQGEKTKVSPPSKLPTPAGKHGKPPDTSGGKKGQPQPVDPKMLNRHIDLSEGEDDMDTDPSPPVSSDAMSSQTSQNDNTQENVIKSKKGV